jgi:hypothetical protein
MRTTLLICVLTIAAFGCGKKKDKAGGDDKSAKTMEPAKDKAPPAPAKIVDLKLPTVGLTIKVPEGTTTEPGIVAGSDSVKLAGYESVMLVRDRSVDEPLDKRLESAKAGQIQVYKSDVFKEGEGTKYAYAYLADQGGKEVVVYTQMFQIDGKDMVCFSNSESAEHAKALKAACDTVTK